jgi:hypothetical protein
MIEREPSRRQPSGQPFHSATLKRSGLLSVASLLCGDGPIFATVNPECITGPALRRIDCDGGIEVRPWRMEVS